MNNILTDALPESVSVDGTDYPLNTDYRACLKIILAFEDPKLTNYERQAVLLGNLYGDNPPPDAEKALLSANWFLNGGDGPSSDNTDGDRLYSFSQDARFIFSAFRQTHGIDLQSAELHWWEFLALFMDLGAETTFCSLTGLRKRVKSGRASKEERQAALELGDIFDVPDFEVLSLEEMERARAFDEFVEQAKKADKQHGKPKD